MTRVHIYAGLIALLGTGMWGCSGKAAPKTAPAASELTLQSAVEQMTKDMASQLRSTSGNRITVIDPIIDRTTGQQTLASARVEQELGPALSAAIKGVRLVQFDEDGASTSQWIVSGTLTATAEEDRYTAIVAITDRSSGLVVAQSVARFTESSLDGSPTRFYNDSPSIGRDRSVDGLVKTSETPAGQPADALYVEQVPTSALLAKALEDYNHERWDRALAAYTAAAGRTDGQQLRTFNGLYLTNMRLGKSRDAEAAFGRIAALGLATNNLAVKLLFKPGSTDFFQGTELTAAYPMWVRQIARSAQSSGNCLNVVGHTSRSGSEAINEKLSLSRAEAVRGMLEREAKSLAGQLNASGVGYRQNIIGSGADNASDAVDRRVEFKVVACKK